ncbi:hypothetical protein E2C01_097456 [Portunus trituberculatus]|uniref:Uncharacterized protein n=1 Tax=Portunus trituberculatus TaxID=210409 RepID=A0A5B7I3D4_PORTR|nr:hypothetical protein [Portunus trituberculatus]MPD01907.1 hypothetical protein [Portunus trituberculatus]
MRRWRGRFTRR